MNLVHKGIFLQEIHRSLTNSQFASRSFTSRTIGDPGSMVMTSMGTCSEIRNLASLNITLLEHQKVLSLYFLLCTSDCEKNVNLMNKMRLLNLS